MDGRGERKSCSYVPVCVICCVCFCFCSRIPVCLCWRAEIVQGFGSLCARVLMNPCARMNVYGCHGRAPMYVRVSVRGALCVRVCVLVWLRV